MSTKHSETNIHLIVNTQLYDTNDSSFHFPFYSMSQIAAFHKTHISKQNLKRNCLISKISFFFLNGRLKRNFIKLDFIQRNIGMEVSFWNAVKLFNFVTKHDILLQHKKWNLPFEEIRYFFLLSLSSSW